MTGTLGPTIAVVTGASSGLGEAFARQIDAHPAYVGIDEIWLVARRGERLQALASALPSGRGRALVADLSLQSGVEIVLARVEASEARLRLLVNNAGVGLLGPLLEQSPGAIAAMLDLNVRAGTLLLRGLAPRMARGAGVLQVASAAAYVPAPYFAVYAASKSYTLALALALREEWRARGISVCTACPGPIDSEFFAVAGASTRPAGMAPDRVVALALRDLLAGRPVSHAGIGPRLLARLANVAPRSVLVRLAGRRNLGRAPAGQP